jgi:ubiquinone/menaquinone biosynthesis C-methylase UbiE
MSNSSNKLSRLNIPRNLEGKAFLDVGCNEGFFCGVAIERGAARVGGIDYDAKALGLAKELYPGAQYLHSSWNTLPDGPFDVVLWTSAMHYEPDPAQVFSEIGKRLSPDGILILECGALDYSSKEMVPAKRHGDTRLYPTIRLLTEELLSDFSVRIMAFGELTEGDPVSRFVFHCRKKIPSVQLIRGSSYDGKSTLADTLLPAATKVVKTDFLVTRLARGDFHHGDLQRALKELHPIAVARGLQWLYDEIDVRGLSKELASVLAENVAATDDLVVIEGAVSVAVRDELSKKLSNKARIWDATKV